MRGNALFWRGSRNRHSRRIVRDLLWLTGHNAGQSRFIAGAAD